MNMYTVLFTAALSGSYPWGKYTVFHLRMEMIFRANVELRYTGSNVYIRESRTCINDF